MTDLSSLPEVMWACVTGPHTYGHVWARDEERPRATHRDRSSHNQFDPGFRRSAPGESFHCFQRAES